MDKGWYIIQVFTGYENKIEKILNKYVSEDEAFGASVLSILVPKEKVEVQKDNGNVKIEEKKILPGYMLLELQLPDEGWNKITSKILQINGVMNFLPGDKSGKTPPKPLSSAEHKKILVKMGEIPEEKVFRAREDYAIGDNVFITSGPFATFKGEIDEVDLQKGRLRVNVQIFGRTTPVDVDFTQVQKVNN